MASSDVKKITKKVISWEEVTERLRACDDPGFYSRLHAAGMISFSRSAVLVPLFFCDGELHVLLTLRSKMLKRHAGQVAFPGGKWEEGDKDNIDTALRESREEIGLEPSIVTVLATLPPILSSYGMVVTPVVGLIDYNSYAPNLNSEEVETVFTVPLYSFLLAETHKSRVFNTHIVHFFENKTIYKYPVWGMTAFFCIMVAALVYQEQPKFQMDIDFTVDNLSQNMENYYRFAHMHIAKL